MLENVEFQIQEVHFCTSFVESKPETPTNGLTLKKLVIDEKTVTPCFSAMLQKPTKKTPSGSFFFALLNSNLLGNCF